MIIIASRTIARYYFLSCDLFTVKMPFARLLIYLARNYALRWRDLRILRWIRPQISVALSPETRTWHNIFPPIILTPKLARNLDAFYGHKSIRLNIRDIDSGSNLGQTIPGIRVARREGDARKGWSTRGKMLYVLDHGAIWAASTIE